MYILKKYLLALPGFAPRGLVQGFLSSSPVIAPHPPTPASRKSICVDPGALPMEETITGSATDL